MRIEVKQKLIAAGVRNLQEFGYPGCNATNIMTDKIYASFFLSILKDNLGHGFDEEINALLAEVKPESIMESSTNKKRSPAKK